MPFSSSPLAFEDIRARLQSALDAIASGKRGIKLTFSSPSEATRWVARANQFRKLDRKRSEKVYADKPMSVMFGSSAFDSLIIRHRKNGETATEVRIEPVAQETLKVEDLE